MKSATVLLAALSVILPPLAFPGTSAAQEGMEYSSAIKAGRVGLPLPNVDLPRDFPAPEGKLTLFADFPARAGEQVPLYLVNRTGKPFEFKAQDGDLYIRLEKQNEDGSWSRAQVYRSSSCGNSYSGASLPSGQHFSFTGYMPSSGTKSRVRFFSYGNSSLVSNDADGFYLQGDLDDANRDVMGRAIPMPLADILEPRSYGGRDAKITPQMQVAALRLVRASGPNPYYQGVAANLADGWEKKSNATSDEKAAVKAVRKILAEPWAEKRSNEALLARCLEALTASKPSGEYGMPEDQRKMVWDVIKQLAEYGDIDAAGTWKEVVGYGIANMSPENVAGLIGIASNPPLADELLPGSFFETHIFDSDRKIQAQCAATLSRRKQWARLTELGWKLDPQGQIIVLSALAAPSDKGTDYLGRPRGPGYNESREVEFWKHCLETQPLESAYALQSGLSGEYNPFDRSVHDPLRDFLAAEAEKGAAADEEYDLGKDGNKYSQAIRLLKSWCLKEDDPIFQKLLLHRGYQKSEMTTYDNADLNVGREFVVRSFRIREEAKEALLRRGQPVPGDLVVERKIPK
jgi:hypothetical protein